MRSHPVSTPIAQEPMNADPYSFRFGVNYTRNIAREFRGARVSMKTQPLVLAVLVALAAACPRPAHGWWDTLCTKFRPVPLVKEIEAEACAGADAAGIVQDKEADGGKGGKAVRLAPGGPGISTEVEVKPGLYGIWVIARDPQGQLGNDLVSLEVKEQAG